MMPMITAFVLLASLAMAVATLLRPPHRAAQLAFSAGMVAFALEAATAGGLLYVSDGADSHAWWLAAHRATHLLVPIPWCAFAFLSARRAAAPIPTGWRVAFAIGAGPLLVTAVASLAVPLYQLSIVDEGQFGQVGLTVAGQAVAVVEILATIGVLYGLEPSIRNSYGSTRWRTKYLALGLVGIFGVRFYLLSQSLLIPVLKAEHLRVSLVSLAGGLTFVAIGLVRTRGLGADLAVSRHFVYRSIVVGIAGTYLILAGTAGWLANALGIPDKTVWGTLGVFVSVMVLATLLLSEGLRWRVKRYVSTHFYAEKYDYRQQWRSFTEKLATRVTLDALVSQLLRSVMETIGTTRAALYLADAPDRPLRLTLALGLGRLPGTVELTRRDFAGRQAVSEAVPVGALGNGRVDALLAAGLVVAVPLASQGRLLGVIFAGPERTEAPYTLEDLELLSTLGEQAASAIASVQLSEQLAQARAFEAFSRLTSFVAHDLKNCIGALSLLSQNAKAHMDDPEFRRDAVRTLVRTVERMQRLLGRLSSRQPGESLVVEAVDLGELVEDTAASMLKGGRIRLHIEARPPALVRADADALQRVLQNLLTNAVEAMEAEGAITVRYARRGSLIACSVSDTGCGMSEEFIRKSLFVPFQTTKKGGWGIGLYQARETMAAHGGQLEVTSEEGHGTTVTLLLPEIQP